jgi:hypothetical protein
LSLWRDASTAAFLETTRRLPVKMKMLVEGKEEIRSKVSPKLFQ